MSSTRLPGKVMKKFGKYSAIEMLIKRIKKSKYKKKILLATTKKKSDDILEKIAKKNKIDFYRGSNFDVLGRLVNGIKNRKEDIIIQTTGDAPFLDPQIIDYMIGYYLKNPGIDFLTNNGLMILKKNTFPIGMHVSIFKRKELINIEGKTKNNLELREHPTLYFYREGKKKYLIKNIKILNKWKRFYSPRLTLDTIDDYKFLKKIFANFNTLYFGLEEILNYLDKNKHVCKLNESVKQKIPTGL